MTQPPAKEVVSEEGEFVSERMGMMISAILEDKQSERISLFNKEKTDEDRFNYVWAMPQLHEVIKLEEEYTGKSSTDAIMYRTKGNKYFQNKSFLSALDAYSSSVINAPVYKEGRDNSNELALAYGNRSAALFYLNRFHHCLDDIDLAFQSGYPKDSHYKLYDRRGKSFLAIGNMNEARDSFNKAMENVEESGLKEEVIGKWKENLTKILVKCENSVEQMLEEPVVGRVLPELTHSPHHQYPVMCKDITVQHTKTRGRHVLADEEISVGDVLAVEKPFASILYQEQYETHCYKCMVKVDRPIPCTQCSTIIYCSQQCRQQAWHTYHQYECRFFVLFDKLLCARIGQLAVRMLMMAGLPFILEYVRNEKNQRLSGEPLTREQRDLNKSGVYDGSYNNVYHLETNSRDMFPVNLFDYTVVAAFLTKALITSKFFQQNDEDYASSENIRLVGSVLLRHLQIIQSNGCRVAEAIQGTQFDQHGNMTVIGMAVYPTTALVNHSCDPVADFVYYRDTLVLRAIRNIYPGEEVNVSYGPVYYDTERKVRQQQLRQCYFFTCECHACEEFFPTVKQLQDCLITFRCEGCRLPLDLSSSAYKKIATCPECQHEQSMEKVVSDLEESHNNFSNGMVDAFTDKYDDAVEKFIKHLSTLQKHVIQPWRDFTSCQLCVKQCYRLLASQ